MIRLYRLHTAPILLILLASQTALGQYYYNDWLGVKQAEQRMAVLANAKVSRVEGYAFLPDGTKQDGFLETTEISPNRDTILQSRRQQDAITRYTLAFDQTGRLTAQSEETAGLLSRIAYHRDERGYITRIESEVSDSLNSFKQRETHSWSVDSKGNPTQMWRIVEKEEGNIDSTLIRFILDSAGQIAEERSYRRGRETGFYYYYYDEHGWLTDIVRYNEKWKRLLPDQLFEYNNDGTLAQRMQLTGSKEVAYLIWRYGYNKNSLVTEEALFNNRKQHTGSIRFTYRY